MFVAALAIERTTELLIAPFVGSGDHRVDRNLLVGALAVMLGVVAAGIVGLSAISLLGAELSAADGSGPDRLARIADVFVTGLVLGAGTKPLHDLIARHERKALSAKGVTAAASSQPLSSGLHPITLRVADGKHATTTTETTSLQNTVDRVLPGFKVGDAQKDVHGSTSSTAGTAAYLGDAFSAAHRLVGAGHPAFPDLAEHRAMAEPTRHRWALEAMGIDAALQAKARGGAGIRVAVVDTGIIDHPDGVPLHAAPGSPLQFVALPGSNVLDGEGPGADNPIADLNTDRGLRGDLVAGLADLELDLFSDPAHGTGVAAVIAAPGTGTQFSESWWDDSPMIGVAPMAEIAPIKAVAGPVQIKDTHVGAAIALAAAANSGVHVISLSVGGFQLEGAAEAVEAAIGKGMIVVCAAGNDVGYVVEPANHPDTIAVANHDASGRPYAGSSRGPEVRIAAPGTSVWRPSFDAAKAARVTPSSGTTYATAHVSGLAALWLGNWGADKIVNAYGADTCALFNHLLRVTAMPWTTPTSRDFGPGIINAQALLAVDVLDNDKRIFDSATLAGDRGPAPIPRVDSVPALVSHIFTADGAPATRAGFLGFISQLWRSEGSGQNGANGVPALIDAELQKPLRLDEAFASSLRAPGSLKIPDGVSAELKTVLEAADARALTDLPDGWGVGLSRPLRDILRGVGGHLVGGRRWLGALALLLAAVAALVGGQGEIDLLDLGRSFVIITVGFSALAAGIERLLEFTVGRLPIAFYKVPGREADRALVLLGVGVLLATLLAAFLGLGLLHKVSGVECVPNAEALPCRTRFAVADLLVTGLALGGGAKPVHDLLTRIQSRN